MTARLRDHGFADAPDYIRRITEAIWNGPGRDPELVHRWYAPDAVIHTDGGDLAGAAAVTANTWQRLRAFPDFDGRIDDTIWTGDDERGHRTSMRWTWTGTHLGPGPWGPPTGRRVTMTAIADCVVRGATIVEEWLGVDRLALTRQLGLSDELALAAGGAAAGPAEPPEPPGLLEPTELPEPTGPGAVVARLLTAALERRRGEQDLAAAAQLLHPRARLHVGPDPARVGQGPGVVALVGLVPGLRERRLTLTDQYWLPAGDASLARVATRWRLSGRTDAGREVTVTGVDHHHVSGGLVVAAWTQRDRLALLRSAGTATAAG